MPAAYLRENQRCANATSCSNIASGVLLSTAGGMLVTTTTAAAAAATAPAACCLLMPRMAYWNESGRVLLHVVCSSNAVLCKGLLQVCAARFPTIPQKVPLGRKLRLHTNEGSMESDGESRFISHGHLPSGCRSLPQDS